MYARFFRWASDRVDENGIVAFISNRSFIDSRTFDGFRKMVAEEFHEIYVVDLGGDVRADPRLSGTKHNVFGIQTGVAISFMVKRAKGTGCRINYMRRPQLDTAEDKLAFLATAKLDALGFERITPNARSDWINQTVNDFEAFIPMASKAAKSAGTPSQAHAIFKLFSAGIKTNRDEWVYDFSIRSLRAKIRYFLTELNGAKGKTLVELAATVKISSSLKIPMNAIAFSEKLVVPVESRPFIVSNYYAEKLLSDRRRIGNDCS